MKALVIEDMDSWSTEIEKALLKALSFIKPEDVLPQNTPSRALNRLKEEDAWKYRLILLDWGFMNTASTAADFADYVNKNHKDALVIIITGADDDKEFLKSVDKDERTILRELLAADAKVIFKKEISTTYPNPDKGLPLLVRKFRAMRLEDTLQQKAVLGFDFKKPGYMSGTVDGRTFRFTAQQSVVVKLLFEERCKCFPGEVTKERMIEALRSDPRFKGRHDVRTDWKPREAFAASPDGLKFWNDHIHLPKGTRGIYCLKRDSDNFES